MGPAGWTGEITSDGGPGFGTLQLGTLLPQLGFASTATASQSRFFDPQRVIALEVALGFSGSIDNLIRDPYSDARPKWDNRRY